jgi:hypothetical protein
MCYLLQASTDDRLPVTRSRTSHVKGILEPTASTAVLSYDRDSGSHTTTCVHRRQGNQAIPIGSAKCIVRQNWNFLVIYIISCQNQKYASCEDVWLSFSRMGFILFYLVEELLFIKSKNWNERM